MSGMGVGLTTHPVPMMPLRATLGVMAHLTRDLETGSSQEKFERREPAWSIGWWFSIRGFPLLGQVS